MTEAPARRSSLPRLAPPKAVRHTLQADRPALVHEAYLRLVGSPEWRGTGTIAAIFLRPPRAEVQSARILVGERPTQAATQGMGGQTEPGSHWGGCRGDGCRRPSEDLPASMEALTRLTRARTPSRPRGRQTPGSSRRPDHAGKSPGPWTCSLANH